MYASTVTNADAFTTAGPSIGFTDRTGKYWPLAFDSERVEAAHDLGVDLPKIARTNFGKLFEGADREAIPRIARLIFIAAGGEEETAAFTPEQLARAIAHPPTFEKAGRALALAVAEYFRNPNLAGA